MPKAWLKSGFSTEEEELRTLDAIIDANLTQLIEEPTHKAGNTLDLVLTNVPSRVRSIIVRKSNDVSDHYPIHINITSQPLKQEFQTPTLDLARANLPNLKQSISHWYKSTCQDGLGAIELWEAFKNNLETAVNSNVPTKPTKSPGQPQWMEKPLVQLMRKRDRLWRRGKKMGHQNLIHKSKQIGQIANDEMKVAVEHFEKNLAQPERAKQFYKYINEKTKNQEVVGDLKDNEGNVITETVKKCDLFNNFFVSVFSKLDVEAPIIKDQKSEEPQISAVNFTSTDILRKIKDMKKRSAPGPDGILSQIILEVREEVSGPLAQSFNKSRVEGKLPQNWKNANVNPIFKKGDKSQPGNFRPVSLTSIICKLMESVIRNSVVKFLENNKKLSPSQHGFRNKRSCTSNLLEYLDEVFEAIDKGIPVDSVYFDLSKAFDKVNHNLLITKLQEVGIVGRLLCWIRDWLSCRRQRVVLNGETSQWAPVTSGVPQGSVLGPVLFIIYINDIGQDVSSSISIFADDTKLFRRSSSQEDKTSLQEDITSLHRWSIKWGMEFNVSKCNVVHFGPKNGQCNYTLNGCVIPKASTIRDLGVQIQADGKWETQVRSVAKKCNRLIGQIKHSFQHRSPSVMVKIFNTYINGVCVAPKFQKRP